MTTPADVVRRDHRGGPRVFADRDLPEAGELVMANQLLLTIGGCAANVAVDLGKMGASARSSAGSAATCSAGSWPRCCANARGRSAIRSQQGLDTSQTLIVNVKGQDRRFIHSFDANAEFRAADISTAPCRVLYLGGYLLMNEVRQEEFGRCSRPPGRRGEDGAGRGDAGAGRLPAAAAKSVAGGGCLSAQ